MVEIGFAPPEEREEIVEFMDAAFPRAKWSRAGWQRLLAGRWAQPGDPFAITARDGGKLAGVLGVITSRRMMGHVPRIYRNLTSWYVLKPWRGQRIGERLMRLALADPTMAVTNLTSARAALPLVDRVGFQVLDRTRCVWRSRGVQATRWPVEADPLRLGDTLSLQDRRVIADHAGLNLTSLAVETPDGPCVMILSDKQKHDDYRTFEVMYLGARDIFARHAQGITDSVLPAQGAVLSADRRFVEAGAEGFALDDIAVPRFYVPGPVAAADVDHLYSEIVLMDMKMY